MDCLFLVVRTVLDLRCEYGLPFHAMNPSQEEVSTQQLDNINVPKLLNVFQHVQHASLMRRNRSPTTCCAIDPFLTLGLKRPPI